MAKKTNDELATLCDSEINDATSYERSTLAEEREKALDFYNGAIDVPAEPGRSSVVSTDVADTVEWIMPQLMRTFMGAEVVAEYEPQMPEDEQFCQQATDYVNYVFLKENRGFLVMYSWFKDALLLKNGIVKHWWDATPSYKTSVHYGLTDDQLAMLTAEDEVEILEHSANKAEGVEPMPGADGVPMVPMLHDVKIRRVVQAGCVKVECVPPEEFLISRRAKSLEDADFCAHKRKVTVSDLIAAGYDPEQVKAIPSWNDHAEDELDDVRWESETSDSHDSASDPSMREVMVYECYIRTDVNGDDIAELMRVLIAGNPGKRQILDKSEVEDIPFSDITPIIMPHRWQGRSIADLVMDIQRIKSVLLRQTLDNLYAANRPQREVVESQIVNPDEVLNPTLGGVVRVKSPNAVRDMAIPFVGQHTFPMLEFMNNVLAWRTGVSATTAAMDPEALQNQTATAVSQSQSQAAAKIELIARVFAETGVKRLFRQLLKLVVAYQDRARIIRLRNEFVEMDPRHWNADMDCTVNIGLGSGSKDRDMALMGQITAKQELIMGALGPNNPLVTPANYYEALKDFTEAAGIRTANKYFGDPRQAAPQPPQPSPEMAKVQAEMQAKQAELQIDAQMQAQKAQQEAQLAQQKAVMEAESRRAQHEAEMMMRREQIAAEMALKREQLAAELQLKREQMTAELQIKRELGMTQAINTQAGGTSAVRPGGEPG